MSFLLSNSNAEDDLDRNYTVANTLHGILVHFFSEKFHTNVIAHEYTNPHNGNLVKVTIASAIRGALQNFKKSVSHKIIHKASIERFMKKLLEPEIRELLYRESSMQQGLTAQEFFAYWWHLAEPLLDEEIFQSAREKMSGVINIMLHDHEAFASMMGCVTGGKFFAAFPKGKRNATINRIRDQQETVADYLEAMPKEQYQPRWPELLDPELLKEESVAATATVPQERSHELPAPTPVVGGVSQQPAVLFHKSLFSEEDFPSLKEAEMHVSKPDLTKGWRVPHPNSQLQFVFSASAELTNDEKNAINNSKTLSGIFGLEG